MYTYKRNGVTLTTDSRKDFLYATKDHAKLEKGRKVEEAKLCTLIVSSSSEEAKMQLRTNTSRLPTITIRSKAAHTRATSFAVAQHSFHFFIYVDRLLAHKGSFIAIFNPDGTGTMAIGLPDEIKYMKDLMFSKDLIDDFTDFKEALQAMMTYDLNKQKVDVLPNIAVLPGPTIMSASTTIPITSVFVLKCSTRSSEEMVKNFPTAIPAPPRLEKQD